MTDPAELEAGLVTRDPEALGRFLVTGLGFEPGEIHHFEVGTVQRFQRGAARCKVFAPVSSPSPLPAGQAWPAGAGFAYAALVVDDAAAELDRALAAGAVVVAPLAQHRPGARMAIVRDPLGNVWELLEEQG